MNTAPSIEVCTSCAAAVFPPRLVCWHCHATSWRRQETPTARVEETTVLRYRIGAVGTQLPVAIATVVTEAGPRLVVRTEARPNPATSSRLKRPPPASRPTDRPEHSCPTPELRNIRAAHHA
jgi:hypothetical protein